MDLESFFYSDFIPFEFFFPVHTPACGNQRLGVRGGEPQSPAKDGWLPLVDGQERPGPTGRRQQARTRTGWMVEIRRGCHR